MSSGLAVQAIVRPVPTASDLYADTVGTGATTAVDLFDHFGIDERMVKRGRTMISIEADKQCWVVFGESSSLAAPVAFETTDDASTGMCKRIPADSPRYFVLTKARRFMRAIADAADTHLEIIKG